MMVRRVTWSPGARLPKPECLVEVSKPFSVIPLARWIAFEVLMLDKLPKREHAQAKLLLCRIPLLTEP